MNYKLLPYVFVNKLTTGQGKIIVFIKGRHINNNTRLVLDMLDYNSLIPCNSLIMSLDFFMAFDSLEHILFFKVLTMFGYGIYFCKIICMFYSDNSGC